MKLFESEQETIVSFNSTQVDEYYSDIKPENLVLSFDRLRKNPYPGLRPFRTNEYPVFFGRQEMCFKLIQRLAEHNFLSVIGASGTGKSSLIRAGLLPSLQSLPGKHGIWKVAICRPGNNPFANLSRAIFEAEIFQNRSFYEIYNGIKASSFGFEQMYDNVVKSDTNNIPFNTLVIIDQFEEIFTYRKDNGLSGLNNTALFVKMLIDISENKKLNTYVLLTMRSEYFIECIEIAGLGEKISNGQFLVPNLTIEQLKDVIIHPLSFTGAIAEEGLYNKLIGEIEEITDSLPILQHALHVSYKESRKAEKDETKPVILKYDHYSSIGKIQNALSLQGDYIYNQFSEKEKQYCKTLFQALTKKTDEGYSIRRPQSFLAIQRVFMGHNELIEDIRHELEKIINSFRKDDVNFLMPPPHIVKISDATEIDISHESLMRQWKLLKDWINAEYNSAKDYERLVESACRYKNGKKGYLEPKELASAIEWEKSAKPDEFWAERYDEAFKPKQYNIEFDEALNYLRESKKEENDRKNAKRFTNYALLCFPVLILLVIGINWYNGIERKKNFHKIFHLNVILADTSVVNPTHALGIAYLAYSTDPENKVVKEQAQKLYENDAFYKTLFDLTDYNSLKNKKFYINCATVSDDRKNFVMGCKDGSIISSDSSISVFDKYQTGNSRITSIAFSPNNKLFATGFFDGSVALYNLKNTKRTIVKNPNNHYITAVAFSPDGKYFIAGSEDKTITLWNIEKGIASKPRSPHQFGGIITSLAFSPDSDKVFVALNDLSVSLWDIVEDPENLKPQFIRVNSSANKHARNNSIASNNNVNIGVVTSVAFSKDGDKIAMGTNIGYICLYYTKIKQDSTSKINHNPVRFSSIHDGVIKSVSFSTDNTEIVSASEDGTIKITDLNGHINRILRGHRKAVLYASFFDNKIISCSIDNTLNSWTIPSEENRRKDFFDYENHIISGTFINQNYIITGSVNGVIKIWNTDPTVLPQEFQIQVSKSPIFKILASSNGSHVLTLGQAQGEQAQGEIKLWKYLINGDKIKLEPDTSFSKKGTPFSGAISLDGNKILVGFENHAALWDLKNKTKTNLPHKGDIKSVAISDDGTKIVTGSATDSTVKIWTLQGSTISEVKEFKKGTVLNSVIFFPKKNNIIIAGYQDNITRISIIDNNKDSLLTPFESPKPVDCVSFSNGNILIGSEDVAVRIWNFDFNNLENKIPSDSKKPIKKLSFECLGTLPASPKVSGMIASKDGKFIFCISGDNIARIWNTKTSKVESFWVSNKLDTLSKAYKEKIETLLKYDEEPEQKVTRNKFK